MAELRKGDYEVDHRHSSVLFKVNHMGLSTYIGRFNDFDASLAFDPEAPSGTWLQAFIDTGSIDVNDSDFEETLAGANWFDSQRFPQARFETTRVEFMSDTEARFHGNLTLRGVTAPLTLAVVFNGGAYDVLRGSYVIGFRASATVKRSEFGMGSYVPAVGDAVDIEVHAEFLRR